jgi:nitrate reductase alpha subunit
MHDLNSTEMHPFIHPFGGMLHHMATALRPAAGREQK